MSSICDIENTVYPPSVVRQKPYHFPSKFLYDEARHGYNRAKLFGIINAKFFNSFGERESMMRKNTILLLFVCALTVAAMVCALQAQTGPAAPGGARQGGGMMGGGMMGGGMMGGGMMGGGMMGGMMGGFGMGQTAPAGPPAPVPPEVSMRPTPDEMQKINAEFKRFIDTNTSANKDLLKKWASILTVQGPRANTATAPAQGFVRSNDRHNKFVETAKNGDFDILFEGDSITDMWQNAGAEAQKKYFGDVKVANFAVSGDTTQGVLWGLQNGEGQGHKPKAVMLMIGTNNTGSNTGPEIAEGVGAVVLELRKDFPDAKVMLLAIFPRGAGASDANRIKNEEANKIIARLHDGKHVFFTNINDKFLNPQGGMVGFGPDNLHPNGAGYETWGAAVSETLKKWAR
jgi:lysophospholipase L1-like esterase